MTIDGETASTSEVVEKTEKKKEDVPDEICSAHEHHDKFNPTAYLESFYVSATEDTAMQIVLFFLPGIIYRLPERVATLLDLGAGPTVYLPIALRNRAEKIYSSDYAPANREALKAWAEKKSTFDWGEVCRWTASIEDSKDTPEEMQEKARGKLQAILEVNVHECPVVKSTHWKVNEAVEVPKKFQVVASIFCLEYSCETLEGYNRAVGSACSLVADGGHLVYGGILDADQYNFDGKIFKSHRLKKSHVTEALKANGFASEEKEGFKWIEKEDIFLLVSKKLSPITLASA